MIWSFFDSRTGEILKRRFRGTQKAVIRNTPAGATAIAGQYDRLSQRVDVATGEVIDYQPPAPSADHEWRESVNDGRPRWVKTAEVVQRERADRIARARIAELEAAQPRAIREHALGDESATARLQAIDQEIAALRGDLIRKPQE